MQDVLTTQIDTVVKQSVKSKFLTNKDQPSRSASKDTKPSRSGSKDPEEGKAKAEGEEKVSKKSKFLMATAVTAAMKPKTAD